MLPTREQAAGTRREQGFLNFTCVGTRLTQAEGAEMKKSMIAAAASTAVEHLGNHGRYRCVHRTTGQWYLVRQRTEHLSLDQPHRSGAGLVGQPIVGRRSSRAASHTLLGLGAENLVPSIGEQSSVIQSASEGDGCLQLLDCDSEAAAFPGGQGNADSFFEFRY